MTEEELRSVAQEHDYSLPDKDGWICPSCEEKEKEAEKNSIQNAGQVCPTCPPEESDSNEDIVILELTEELENELTKLKESVGSTKRQLALQEDVDKILSAFQENKDQMTIDGHRIEPSMFFNWNNTCRTFPNMPLFCGGRSDHVKDCGEQTEYMNNKLSQLNLNYEWQFDRDSGVGHAWGIARPYSPDMPYVTYDTRSGKFAINKQCSTCKPWVGKSIYEDEEKWIDKYRENGGVMRGSKYEQFLREKDEQKRIDIEGY